MNYVLRTIISKNLEYKKVKLSELKETNVGITEPLISITTPVFISNMILPLFFVLSIIWVLVKTPDTPYFFPLIVVLAFITYRIWQLFEPVNIILVNKKTKLFELTSRNPIKRVFIKKTTIPFTEIRKFIISDGSEFVRERPRYIISVILKDSITIPCLQTSKKIIAEEALDFFSPFLGRPTLPNQQRS